MASPSNSIITTQQPRGGSAALVGPANTNWVTPVNTVLVMTAGPNGARLTKLRCLQTGTVIACQIQLFRSLDAGVTKRFANDALMPAFTALATANLPVLDFGYSDANPMIMAPNEQLYMAVGVATVQINVELEWGDY
jgi:hypothetical protein